MFLVDKKQFKTGHVIKIRSVWSLISPKPIWHYGVVVGYDDVVHFNLNVDIAKITIIRTDLKQFKGIGTSLQICSMSEFHKKYDEEEIVKRAISAVGTDFGGYNLLHNNCEHFANWCVSGEKFCNQLPFNEGTNHTLPRKVFDKTILEPCVKYAELIEDLLPELLEE